MRWTRTRQGVAASWPLPTLSFCLAAATLATQAVAQQPPPRPTAPAVRAAAVAETRTVTTIEQLPAGVEVLMRGPVHQAFAQPYPDNERMMRVDRPVPAPLRERPAATRPSDPERTAEWLPGYWAVEPETRDLVWVSGIWRFPPPGMQWVPGYWHTRGPNSTWVSGFWIDEQIENLEFLPRPPEPRDTMPADEPPSRRHFWVPGNWVYDRGEYVWEPGSWAEAQPGWVWEPSRYLQTPSGWVFVDGYWDFEPTDRGLMFAPVRFEREAVEVTREVRRPVLLEETYWPQVAIAPRHAMVHWFAQPNYGHYYFGNYYDPAFAQRGILPWAGFQRQPTFFDPLAWYFRAAQPRLLNQMVQTRGQIMAQPALQPATVFSTDIAAAQLPNFVRTVDMLMEGEGADGFARVETEVLDQYSEQLQQYEEFNTERMAARAELGDEGAAQVQEEEAQLSEQRRTDDAPRTADEPRDTQLDAEDRVQRLRPDADREELRRPGERLEERRLRPDQPGEDDRPRVDTQRLDRDTDPRQRRETPPEPRADDEARPADAPRERPGDEPRETPREQPRDEPRQQRGAPADPRTGEGADPQPRSGVDPRPGAPADPRPGSPADPRPGSPAQPRPGVGAADQLDARGRAEARAEAQADTRAEARADGQAEVRSPQQQRQLQQRQAAEGRTPEAAPGQRLDLNRLRQIQMPDGLPRAQGLREGQSPRYNPPQRLGRPGGQPAPGAGAPGAPGGRPGILPGRGPAPQEAQQGAAQGAAQGRPGILQRLTPGGR